MNKKQNIQKVEINLFKSILTFISLAGMLLLSACLKGEDIPVKTLVLKTPEDKARQGFDIIQTNVFTKSEVKLPLRAQERLLSGKYLAGRQAIYSRDISAAAALNFDILKHKNFKMGDIGKAALLRRAFSLNLTDGRYDKALILARQIDLKDKNDNLISLFLYLTEAKKALKSHDENDYKKSFEYLEKLENDGIYGLFKPFLKAWLILEEGKADKKIEILKILKNIFAKKGFSDFKNYQAALLLDALGMVKEADEYYKKSLSNSGAMTLRTAEIYGNYLVRNKKQQTARVLYQGLLKKLPANETLSQALKLLDKGQTVDRIISSSAEGMAEVFYSSARYLAQDQMRAVAILYLRQALYIREEFPEGNHFLGQVLEQEKLYNAALEALSKVGKQSILNYHSQAQSAWIYNKMKKPKTAISLLINLIGEYPEHNEIYGTIGDIYRIDQNFNKAAHYYDLYISGLTTVKSYHWGIFFTRGIAYERIGRWKDAEKDFLKALELNPDEPQVLNYLAYSWVDQGLHYEKSKKMLEKAVQLLPNDGYIIDSLGWALFKMGQIESSVPILEKAVQLKPDDWALNDHLGDAYWLVGRENEARFQWRHALSLKPDEDKIQGIKNKINHGYSKENK